MKHILTIIILILPLFTSAQKKKNVNSNYEKGTLVDGRKIGEWSYYDNGILMLKVNYSTGKIMYIHKDTTKYAVKTKDGWQLMEMDIFPHYIGSHYELTEHFYKNLKYPAVARRNKITGTVLLGFEINLLGHVDSIKLLKDIGGGCGKIVLKTFKNFLKNKPNRWLVAQKGKNKYVTRYILPVEFKLGRATGNKVKFIDTSEKEIKELNEIKEKYSPSNYLDTIVVSAIRQ